MKWQIEVFLPSQDNWLSFYKPFSEEMAAHYYLNNAPAILLSQGMFGNFQFRIVGVHD